MPLRAGKRDHDGRHGETLDTPAVTIAATQTFPGPAWAELPDVTLLASWPPAEPLPGVEVLVEAVVAVGPAELDLLPDLRLVANYGVGYDRVDVPACRGRGIAVTNTPGVLDAAVADLTLALILACRRHLVESDRFVREGRWQHGWARPSCSAATSRARGSALWAWGGSAPRSHGARTCSGCGSRTIAQRRRPARRAARIADVVSLHVPLTPETHGLVSRERLALLQDGATLVNTARGAIVDEDALVDELVSGRISAGLDVFADEPRVPERLLDLPNVVLTPHIASATVETRAAMTRVLVDNVLASVRGEPLPNEVLA